MTRPGSFVVQTLAEVNRASYREDGGTDPALDETRWAIGRLSDTGLERLRTFIEDLTRRAPLAGPAWEAHRGVFEALVSDIVREEASREKGAAHDQRNGT